LYQKAINDFKKSLDIDENFQEAKFSLDLAKQKLDESSTL